MFNNQIIAGAAGQGGGAFYDYSIDQSLRFDGTASYLEFTPSNTATDSSKITFSTWVKTWGFGISDGYILSAGASNIDGVGYNPTNNFTFIRAGGTAVTGNAVRRDPSAWYHLYVTYEGDGDQKVRIYVNGTLDNEAAQTVDLTKLGVNGQIHRIVRKSNASTYLDLYLAETHFVDGSIVPISTFAETKNGVWTPVQASGITYGNNGWYLDYADSSDVGKDVSGRGNHWTAYSLAAEDVVPDSPTNNFATFNILDKYNYNAPSEGNLRALTAGNNGTQATTFAVSSGKWYFEVRNGTAGSASLARFVGIGKEDTILTTIPYNNADNYLYYSTNGNTYSGGTSTSYGDSWQTSGDIIGVALDMDNGAIYFSKNGTWQNSATAAEIAAGTTTNAAFTGLSGIFVPLVAKTGGTSSNDPHDANFGQNPSFNGNLTGGDVGTEADDSGYGLFKYPVPSGFNCLATANLPEPAIGPNSATTNEQHFNTVLYTGDGTSSNAITGVGFQPDFVWIKTRNGTASHALFDSVRGADNVLRTNGNEAENNSAISTATYGGLTSFDSDGFTVDDGSDGTFDATNGSSDTYVSWNWKAGGTASTIAVDTYSTGVPSIASSVSANTDAGFSIVSYDSDGTNGTVGHGLNNAPEMVIVKSRTGTAGYSNWGVYHSAMGNTNNMYLNTTGAQTNQSAWNATSPTNNVVSLGAGVFNATPTQEMIMYCFHSVEGFSKVGTYYGNTTGYSNGVFVYTGFRPAFLMTKAYGTNSAWVITDNERNSNFNGDMKRLYANTSAADASFDTNVHVEFYSNGFSVHATTASSDENRINQQAFYTYLAFAEAPFKYANAR